MAMQENGNDVYPGFIQYIPGSCFVTCWRAVSEVPEVAGVAQIKIISGWNSLHSPQEVGSRLKLGPEQKLSAKVKHSVEFTPQTGCA